MSQIFDLFVNGNRDVEFLANLPNQTRGKSFARLNFPTRKLPKIRQMIVRPPLRNQQLAVIENQSRRDIDRFQVSGRSICR